MSTDDGAASRRVRSAPPGHAPGDAARLPATQTPAAAGPTGPLAARELRAADLRRFRARVGMGLLARSHVAIWLAVVLAVFAIGSAGYIVLFHWSLSDALFMTVITLTTVGYREVRDLDDLGRAWTSLVSVAGVGIIFGTVGIVVESFVRELTSGRREEQRMMESIGQVRDHFVLCGYGRVGSTVARELTERGNQVVIIDMRQDSLERARRDGYLVVQGDATEDATLEAAGLSRARGLVTTLDSDANNVYVVLSARAIQPDLFILGRANGVGAESKLEHAGADRVVSPYTMAGRRIAELALRPKLADFIDLALSTGEEAFSLEEVEVRRGSRLDGRTVGDLRTDGVFTLAVLPEGGDYAANPPDDRRFVVGDNLVLSGSSQRLQEIRSA